MSSASLPFWVWPRCCCCEEIQVHFGDHKKPLTTHWARLCRMVLGVGMGLLSLPLPFRLCLYLYKRTSCRAVRSLVSHKQVNKVQFGHHLIGQHKGVKVSLTHGT